MDSKTSGHLVVAVWNKADITRRFLDSFSRCSETTWRLILVDNGSTDDTPALLSGIARKNPLCTVLRNEKNVGCSGAWNRGIRLALEEGSSLIGVLNNDLVFAPHWDAGLLSFHQSHPEHPVFSPHTMKCPLEEFEPRASAFMKRNAHRTRLKMGSESMFFDPAIFRRIGLFDERYFVSYEDTDYYLRLVKEGIHPVITGASVLWHREKTTRGEMGSAHELEARAEFVKKWGDLEILKTSGWMRSRWVIRYWRYRERLGLL